jgi:toxin ParE1/3/4
VRLKWTDLASIDLDEIEAPIAQKNSAQENSPIVTIEMMIITLDSTHRILPDHPRAGHQGRLKNTRELMLDGIPFIVIYREHISTNCIEILRVLHDAQQWPTAT